MYQQTRYRVSHNIGPTLFFAVLSASTLPKYKSWVSFTIFRKLIGTRILKIDSELAEIFEVKDGTNHLEIDILLLHILHFTVTCANFDLKYLFYFKINF